MPRKQYSTGQNRHEVAAGEGRGNLDTRMVHVL